MRKLLFVPLLTGCSSETKTLPIVDRPLISGKNAYVHTLDPHTKEYKMWYIRPKIFIDGSENYIRYEDYGFTQQEFELHLKEIP